MRSRLLHANGCLMALLCIFFCLSFAGCKTLPQPEGPPGWWDPGQTRKHDKSHLYFKAQVTSADSLEQAREDALRSIKAQISEYIISEVKLEDSVDRSKLSISSKIKLHEVEMFDEEYEKTGGSWTVWMLGRYPRKEYSRIRGRIEHGIELEKLWLKAQSALNRQQNKEAEDSLLKVVQEYDEAVKLSFDLEAVKLKLAGLYLKSDRCLEAKQWIRDVQRSTLQRKWKQAANILDEKQCKITLGDAFRGSVLGLYCCTRREGVTKIDLGLAQKLNGRLAKYGVETDFEPKQRSISNGIFGKEQISKIVAMYGDKTDAMLIVLLDVDSSKTGKRLKIPGTNSTMKAYDAKLYYWLVKNESAVVLASDHTIGFSESVDALLNTMLTHRRHMPKYISIIAEIIGKIGR